MLGVGVLVVALVLGGLAAVDRLRGGASSPVALAERVTTALTEEDLPALVRLVDPDERAALLRLAGAWTRRLAELDLPQAVGGGTEDGRPLEGLDLTLTGTTPQLESRSGDVAVVGLPDLVVQVRSTPDDAHGLLLAWFADRHVTRPQDLTYPAASLPAGLAPRLVAVERSGRWYVSLLATLFGPGIAEGSTPQLGPVRLTLAPSPQAAAEATVRALVVAAGGGDAQPLAQTLDPSGSDAVRLWAAEVDTSAAAGPVGVDALSTSPGPVADRRAVVRVDTLHVTGGSTLDVTGPCLTSGRTRSCLRPTGYRYDGGLGSLGLLELLGRDGAFSLTTVGGDDGWRTSLPETLADALIAYGDRLSRPQVLMVLGQERLDAPSGGLQPDRAADVRFTDGGYVLQTLHVGRAGLYRVVPSPTGSNRASLYDAEGNPDLQPFFPNDSVYRLAPGDHTLLVWADDAFSRSLEQGTPYVQRVEVRSVG